MSVIHQVWTTIEEGLTALGDIIWDAAHMIVAMGNAPKCIKSAILLPVSADDFRGENAVIWLGEYRTGLTGKALHSRAVASQTCSISIPWQANDWRKLYHTIYLFLPYSGVVNIPASEVISASSILITCFVSQSGAVTYEVNAAHGTQGQSDYAVSDIGVYYGNCAGAFMIGESQSSLLTSLSATSAAITGVAATVSAATTGSVLSAAATGANSITGVLSSMQPCTSMVGGGGGGAFASSYIPSITTVFHDTTVAPDSVSAAIGTPAMAVKTIGSLSGYVQTANASVNVAADAPIRQRINQLLDGGIFYE